MALAVGALVAMPVAGRLADRWTGRRLLRLSAPAAALALAGPALAGSAGTLAITAIGLGMLLGVLNVALTVQAVAVERLAGRPVMTTMHGIWTLGAVAGGGAVAAGQWAGAGVRVLLVAGAVALATAMVAAGRGLVEVSTARTAAAGTVAGAADPVPIRPALLVALGLLGAAAFVAEATATDWAGFHATRVLGADAATGSLAYTLFLAAMTVVRFAGDAARSRLGVGRTIRLAGCTATAGFGLVLLAGELHPDEPAQVGCALAGWALTGAGVAVVWPVVTSTLGAAGGPARQLSAVTTISYGGGLLAPALLGFVAARASLPAALLIPAALAVAIAVGAPAVLAATTRAIDRPRAQSRTPNAPHTRPVLQEQLVDTKGSAR
jgi:MFS family permease